MEERQNGSSPVMGGNSRAHAFFGIDADRVSIKATTSEKLGFVGRREGMAAWAVAAVKQMETE